MPELRKSKNPMASTWTKAAKVRRQFKAGRQRQKDLVLTPTRAIFEGYILLHEIQQAMSKEGLPESDVQAALVFMMPGASDGFGYVYVFPIPETKRLPELYAKVRKIEKTGPEPLGVAIHQQDREADSGPVLWIQPWLTNPRAVRALTFVKQVLATGIREEKQLFN